MIAEASDTQVPYAERERKRLAERSRTAFKKASDIGGIPAVENPKRRAACKFDLQLFLQWYFPHSTGLAPFGSAQCKVIERIQTAILSCGRVLNCMPRGYVKSTISENAILWAELYGHRRYAVLFAATSDEASDAIASIKTELFENDRLHDDFPEVCHPIRALEGRSIRALTQTHEGELTHLVWRADTIVLPTIPGSAASGAIIRSKGYTSASRGMRYKRSDGTQARPDLVIPDDPQTDESAVTPAQVGKRMTILRKTILRLGGHGRAVAAVMNATVIADGDMVDQLADHSKHPEWQAIRVKMMPSMPDALDSHWLQEYKRLRHNYDPEIDGDQRRAHEASTQFYRDHRDVMDTGAGVSWEHIPLEEGEISAIQHAMNVLIDDGEDVFASECQNEPRRAIPAGVTTVDAEEVKTRHSGFARYVVPDGTAAVVAHCDIHDAILYWTVAAVANDFTGYVVDYGIFPEQPTSWFSMASLKRTLQQTLKTDTIEEAISSGVTHVVNSICGRVWASPNGSTFNVSALLFDVGYKQDEVAKGVRMSDFASSCWGSRGIGIGPIEKPMPEYDVSPKRARRAGPNPMRPRWYVPRESINGLPVVRFDANYWKSLVAARWTQTRESSGAWSIYGNHRTDHAPYADHLTAEDPIPITAKGRTVTQWKLKPNRENHWWDTNVGCAVAASLSGVPIPGGVNEQGRSQNRPRRRRRKTQSLNC